MTRTSTTPLLREVQHLIGAGRDDLPDGQLLDRFARERDEVAFEALVRRYGRLVFGVCRQVLADRHAAEDAFQATFLVLVHKASSLDRGRPVGDWLYTVAFRLALRSRANAARRREKEAEAARDRAATAPPPAADEQAAVHEELNRLPDRLRLPLVLACLEGRTHEQVARAIGCPVGSVGWRLARAKEVLRDRLAGRGVACPAAALLAPAAAGAAVPAPLLEATVRAGVWFAGDPAAGVAAASANAVELARGVLGTMTTNKLTVAAGVLLAVGLCGSTAWLARSAAMGDGPKPAARATEPVRESKPAGLPPGATARLGTSQFRHGEPIFFLAYTADGRRLITAGRDDAIRLWDRKTGEEVRRFDRPAKGPAEQRADAVMMAAGGMMMRTPLTDGRFPVALSPDGKLLAAGRGKSLFVWEIETGAKRHELTAAAELAELSFTPDGKTLVACDQTDAVTLWDLATGKVGRTHQTGRAGQGDVVKTPAAILKAPATTSTATSPDGRHLVTQQFRDPATGDTVLRVTDLGTGKQTSEIKLGAGGVQVLAFSPDGKRLAWASFLDGVVVWDLAGGKEVARFGRDPNTGPPRAAQSLGFSADGNTLAVSLQNEAVELWDVPSAKKLRTIGGHEPERSRGVVKVAIAGRSQLVRHDLAFSPDGKTVAASLGNASVRQFDTGTGDEVSVVPGHATAVIAAGSDGRSVTTVSKESVRVWDAATGRAVRDWPLNPPAWAAAVSPDGRRVATAGGGTVRLWDPATGKEVRQIDTRRPDVAGLGFSPDGALLATKEGLNTAVCLWDTTTGELVRTIGQDGESPFAGGVVRLEASPNTTPAVAFTADGRRLAAVGEKKQLCVWDVATGVLVREFPAAGPQHGLAAFAFSGNGQSLAVLSGDGAVTVYEVATGERRYGLKPDGPPPADAGWSFPKSGVFSLDAMNRGNATAGGVGFTPDGRLIVSATGGPAVRVWDALTGQEVAQLKGHRGSVTQLQLAPDGRHAVSGGVDTTAVVWDLARVSRVELMRETPLAAADLDALWADLAKPDPGTAHAATRQLLTDRPAAVGLLAERVRPVPAVDEARIAKLIADLGGKFDARRKATAELEQLGELAAPQLRKALDGRPSLDLKQRLERLLEKATVERLDGDRLRALRAVEVLELAGTPEARRALEGLARGAPGARLTRDAKAAADRMGHKTAD